jgi:hypothetical protein
MKPKFFEGIPDEGPRSAGIERSMKSKPFTYSAI